MNMKGAEMIIKGSVMNMKGAYCASKDTLCVYEIFPLWSCADQQLI